jgi:hypothetical protein
MANAAAERNIIDESTIVLETGVDIPRAVRGSKYPWAPLMTLVLQDPETLQSFFAPIGSEQDAKTSKASVHASGSGFFSNRNLPFKVVTRVMAAEGDPTFYGVRAWVVPVAQDVEETDED